MASTVKRIAAGVLAVWFSFWSVFFPITAHAAVYDAASNLTGRSWYVPGVGTSAAGNRALAAGATMLGRANPWIAAITIGMPIAQTILELKNGSNPVTPEGLPLPPEAGFAPSPATLPTPEGWGGPDSPPTSAQPVAGEAGPAIGESIPAVPGTGTVPRVGVCKGAGAVGYTGSVMSESDCVAAVEAFIAAQGYSALSWTDSWTQTMPANATQSAQLSRHFCKYGTNCGWTETAYILGSCQTGTTWDSSSQSCVGTVYSCPDVNYTLSGQSCVRSSCPLSTPVLVDGTCYSSPSCPDGYILNYDSCLLAENAPYKVKWPNGTNGNVPAFVPDPTTPGEWKPFERNSPAGTPSSITAQQIMQAARNSQNTYTQDQYGNPVLQQVTPNPNGGLTYTQQVQTTNGTQTTTTTNTYTINNLGQVTNASTVTNNGPITNISNNYASSSSPVEFPNDYNKEATQAKILSGEGSADAPDWASSINEKTENIGKGITDLLDPIAGQYADDKNKWFSWVWTPPVGNCSPFTGTIHNKSVTWDICPYVEMVRNAIGWLFSIVGAWVIYNNMFRREDA